MKKSHLKKPLTATSKKKIKTIKKVAKKATLLEKKAKVLKVGDSSGNQKNIPDEDLNNLDKLKEKIVRTGNVTEAKEELNKQKEEDLLNPSPSGSGSQNMIMDPAILDGVYNAVIDIFEGLMRLGNQKILKCRLDPFTDYQRQALKTSGSSLLDKVLPQIVIENPEVFGFTLCVVSIWAVNTKPIDIEIKPQETPQEKDLASSVPGAEGAR